MPDRDVSKPYIDTERPSPSTGGHRAEDEPDIDGYDETQRAEIAEVESVGPNDGVIATDLLPDFGGDLDGDAPIDVMDNDDDGFGAASTVDGAAGR